MANNPSVASCYAFMTTTTKHLILAGLEALANNAHEPYFQGGFWIVHLIEVGYTGDYGIHARVAHKLNQHRDLQANLLQHGWKEVQVHTFVATQEYNRKAIWLYSKPCRWTTPTAYLPMCICTA